MKSIIWVGLAGAAGAILRVILGAFIHSNSGFPVATLLINLIGTFLLCFIISRTLRKVNVKQQLYDAVTTGFLGSFTTFSALTIETVFLMEQGLYLYAILYVVSSIIGGLAAGAFGLYLGDGKVRA